MGILRLSILGTLLLVLASVGLGQSSSGGSNEVSTGLNRPYQVVSQPQAKFPLKARAMGIEGLVRLKIVLSADGTIGEITDVTPERKEEMERLGFTANAIKAAKKIKFRPKMADGIPKPVRITREYAFLID